MFKVNDIIFLFRKLNAKTKKNFQSFQFSNGFFQLKILYFPNFFNDFI